MQNIFKLRELTSTSWIATKQGERQALLVKMPNKMLWLTRAGMTEYASAAEICSKLDIKFALEEVQTTEKNTGGTFVGPYPVKHTEAFNQELEPVPSYTKTATSDVRYAAGYWAFLFANGWQGSWCPKMQTLADYTHAGPFTSKLEMQTAINQKNNLGV